MSSDAQMSHLARISVDHRPACLPPQSRVIDHRCSPAGERGVRVAVLIPAFNAAPADLMRAISSVSMSTVEHDIVLVDDGSGVPVAEFVSSSPNLVVIRFEHNKGIVAALNAGLAFIASEGYPYAARLDADDWMTPDRLSKQMTFMDNNCGITLLGTWSRVVNEDGQLLYENRPDSDLKRFRTALKYRNPIVHSSIMLRVVDTLAAGGYSLAFQKSEDYELIRRLDNLNAVAVLPEVLSYFQVSQRGVSSARTQQVAVDLRVKLIYFSFLSPHSYLGLLKTAVSVFMPRSWIVAARRAEWFVGRSASGSTGLL